MAEPKDGGPGEDRTPNVVIVNPRLGRRWMVPGGEEDEGGITLHVVTSDPDGVRARRFHLRVPLDVDGAHDLVVGAVTVEEAP